ncbi:hypothetical protein MRB53_025481 [Persea americana]|uniref:Uncharacterized protein n=1 Tax=Persea americana TaxID=3435 RepID=A0ACC2LFB8_PERAE|nr:hypothetical protein MRB53_025481 [Persea americana]
MSSDFEQISRVSLGVEIARVINPRLGSARYRFEGLDLRGPRIGLVGVAESSISLLNRTGDTETKADFIGSFVDRGFRTQEEGLMCCSSPRKKTEIRGSELPRRGEKCSWRTKGSVHRNRMKTRFSGLAGVEEATS